MGNVGDYISQPQNDCKAAIDLTSNLHLLASFITSVLPVQFFLSPTPIPSLSFPAFLAFSHFPIQLHCIEDAKDVPEW